MRQKTGAVAFGLDDGRVRIMGILNVTPDSFSDGGCFLTEEKIIAQADKMAAAGADFIDIGGESSRPFAAPVSMEEEIERVVPAVRAVRRRHHLPISIDTTKAEVARRAIDAGADLINDISALRFDPEMIKVAVESGVPVVIMHMQGAPEDMQLNPVYDDVLAELAAFFKERLAWADQRGLPPERIILDPGIGFGKTVAHNLTILKHLDKLRGLGRPVLVGHSRKAFIGKILGLEVNERDAASAALSALLAAAGVSILRVHDVDGTRQAVRMAEAVKNVDR